MSVPMWVLLAFAGWTLAILLVSVGVYRWSMILTGRAKVNEFPADGTQGAGWYQRAMRAHMNCIENLPVYGAIVVAAQAAMVSSVALDRLALAVIATRIGQSLVHISLPQTEGVVFVRFSLFSVQFVCMSIMGVLIALQA